MQSHQLRLCALVPQALLLDRFHGELEAWRIDAAFVLSQARASVIAACAVIRESKISSDPSSIREFHQFVVRQGGNSPLAPRGSFIDFYSMSMCRDLMSHVQEHQMRPCWRTVV